MDLCELLKQAKDKINKEVKIKAWVGFNRNSKKIGFLTINDGTKFESLQVVYKLDSISNFAEISKLTTASSIEVKGMFIESKAKGQSYELLANEINIIKISDSDYPLQSKEHSFEFLREIAHLRPKTQLFRAVFKIRSVLGQLIHKYFIENDYLWVHAPIITENDAEGAGESFTVTTRTDDKYSKDFFSKKASLTVSGQLTAEAYAQAFRKVYSFGPTFRAENSNTLRHAAEFWMLEPELAFGDLNDDLNLTKDLIKYLIKNTLKECRDELVFLNDKINNELIFTLEKVASSEFPRLEYRKAIEILQEAQKNGVNFEFKDIHFGIDLATEHEKYLSEKHFEGPVFVINYPKEIKAFYMRMNEDNETVAAFDLLVPGIGELVGGSQREERYDELKKRMQELNLDNKELEWYLNMRRFGSSKSCGFGLGFERLVMYFTGMANIRDVIPFPRTPRNLKF